jgi:plastocyanin
MIRLLPLLALAAMLLVGCAPREDATTQPTDPAHTTTQPQPGQTGEGSVVPPGGTRDIQIRAVGMTFEPNRIEARPGERIRVVLDNPTGMPHAIDFELPGAEVNSGEVPAGSQQAVEFTAPDQPGEYTFYCPVGNHREQGMTGTLIVQ